MPTVKDLKKLAKERCLRRYHNLKKAELLSLLRPIPAPRRPIPTPRKIMNIRNPEINIPILIPETVKVKPNIVKRVAKKTVETFTGWMSWLAESGQKYIVKPISSSLKNLKEKINAIFEKEKEFKVREGESALKNFVRVHH